MRERTPAPVLRTAAEDLCDEDELLRMVSEAPPRSPARSSRGDQLYRVPPIYFIGDSRAVPFRNSLYVSEFTLRTYQLRSVHLRALHAADFYSPGNGLNLPLMNALATDMAVITRDEGARWAAEDEAAPLVLFCGLYDVLRVLDELGPDAAIPGWDAMSRRYDHGTTPASRTVSAEEAVQRAFARMEPLATAIEALQAMGFVHIFVHGFPRARRGERFQRLYGKLKARRQHDTNTLLKVHMLFDEVARSIARRTSTRYVAGAVDANGEILEHVTEDYAHYNARGVREVARTIVSILEGVVE